jgi:hypothetical protein
VKVKKTIVIIIIGLILGLIYLYILALGYGGGKSVRPVEPNEKIINLEKELKTETRYSGSFIDLPRNYQLDNCSGILKQEISLYLENDSLKQEETLKNYVIGVNKRLQKIFPYDKKCYDSVIIQTQYFDNDIDSTINKRFSFPMIK